MSNSVKFDILNEGRPKFHYASIPSVPRKGDPVILDEGAFEVVNVIWRFTTEDFNNQRRFAVIELRRVA